MKLELTMNKDEVNATIEELAGIDGITDSLIRLAGDKKIRHMTIRSFDELDLFQETNDKFGNFKHERDDNTVSISTDINPDAYIAYIKFMASTFGKFVVTAIDLTTTVKTLFLGAIANWGHLKESADKAFDKLEVEWRNGQTSKTIDRTGNVQEFTFIAENGKLVGRPTEQVNEEKNKNTYTD